MTQPYRPDIDGLRAVAVLLVVVFHAFPQALPGGFLGVDVFFVISGYLITGDIVRRQEQGAFSLIDFYARRARRILPALTVVLAAAFAFGAVVLYSDEFEKLLQHVLSSALFSQNFRLMSEAGYFDAASIDKPLLHLWSLAVEEQFYLLWPLAIGVLKTRRAIKVAAVLTLVVSVAAMHALEDNQVQAYYLPITRAWELMAGAVIAVFHTRPRFAVAGAALVGWGVFFASVGAEPPLLQVAIPTVLGAAIVIAAGPLSPVSRVLSARPLVWVGLISYPLYLWHWPLLSFLHIMQPVHAPAATAAAVAIAAVLAWLTRRYVEQPFRRPGPAQAAAAAALASLGASAAVACMAVVLLLVPVRQPLAQETKFADLRAELVERRQCPWASSDLLSCMQSRPGAANAVILGDSHADHLFDGMAAVDGSRNWLVMAKASCPPLLGADVKIGQRPGCGNTPAALLKRIAADSSLQLVVLSYFGSYAASTNYAADHLLNALGPAQTAMTGAGRSKAEIEAAGLRATVEALTRAGKAVVIALDVPELPFRPRDCVARPLTQAQVSDCAVSQANAAERRSSQRAAVDALQRDFPALRVFDPLDVLCDGVRCSVDSAGGLLFKDSHHLSRRGSEVVARALVRRL